MVMTKPDGVTEWIGASPVARGAALVQLLGLADALPQGLRREGSPSLVEKVVAVDQALSEAGLPHAIGGAIALAYYGEPRTTVDIDVNVFIPVDRWPEVRSALAPLVTGVEVDPKELSEERQARLAWDRNPVHLFFSYDELHEEMPRGIRRVPFGGAEIPIVSPEHLVIRKATLDRTKDWLDIEAVLIACDALDLGEVECWLARLAGPEDERVTKLHQLTARLAT
jgi:hypothetical protein